jgi:hypothetical protein
MTDEQTVTAAEAKEAIELADTLYKMCPDDAPKTAVALIMLCATFLIDVADTKQQLRERISELTKDIKDYAEKGWESWEASQRQH